MSAMSETGLFQEITVKQRAKIYSALKTSYLLTKLEERLCFVHLSLINAESQTSVSLFCIITAIIFRYLQCRIQKVLESLMFEIIE